MSLSSCHQEPPWQRQEGTSGGSPVESGKTGCTCSYVSLYVKHYTCSSESSISDLPWHAANKKAEPELSPQDKKGQRTAIITGFISVAFGVSGSTAIPQKTMPEGGICCSTVQWSSCCTYCRDIFSSTATASAAQCRALYTTARTSALQLTTDSLLGDCMAPKTDCRKHSNVLCVTGGISFVSVSA